jgi:hypothetical protein
VWCVRGPHLFRRERGDFHVARVRNISELPADVRGDMLYVLGHEAVQRGLSRDGTVNRLGRELDEVAEALGLYETPLAERGADQEGQPDPDEHWLQVPLPGGWN